MGNADIYEEEKIEPVRETVKDRSERMNYSSMVLREPKDKEDRDRRSILSDTAERWMRTTDG